MSQGYGAGYDGADIKAIQAAWQVFVRTEGLQKADQRIDRYWFRIQVDETYRIVQILPKVTMEDYPPEYTRTHWPFGTEGKFWVHKATFEVDKKEVIPPP